MESFWGSVELMVFVYALAAVVSYLVALILRLFAGAIERRKARAAAEPVATQEAAD